ncbi:hypothetical protein D3C84_1206280 [compost metagenome]
MRTEPLLLPEPDVAASVRQASYQFPLELSPPLAGTCVVSHAERTLIDRFLTALHGGNSRCHQQVCKFAYSALTAG